MSDIAIQIEGTGKLYRLGVPDRFRTLVDSFTSRFRRMRSGAPADDPAEQFRALRDISFDVNRGEVVGVIGWNGPGRARS
jgi:ABC-type polysaccharide/polyol phosphate transport system ATPase subunit